MREGGDFKNNDLHPIGFDRAGKQPYYTRPMAPGLPDRVDCAQLADGEVVLERSYPLAEMPRLQDLLADPRGSVHARFAFANLGAGRAGAAVAVKATPQLVCQRCMQGFEYAVDGGSEVEFSGASSRASADSPGEVYETNEGLVSLRELAEEELLLALPIVAMHEATACALLPDYEAADETQDEPDERTRPFIGLQDLLKKT
jgi:uncharacterized protein